MDEPTPGEIEDKPAIEAKETPITKSALGEVDRIRLAKSLGLNSFGDLEKYDADLNRLVEWAKANGAVDAVDMIGKVKQLGTRLGDKTLNNLSLYAYLELERIKLDTKMRRLEDVPTKEN